MLEEEKKEGSWEENSSTGGTFEESEEKKDRDKKMKNLIALVILLAGVAVGSLFIDLVQLFSGKGYSQKVLKTVDVFEDAKNDKTWVAYPDGVIKTEVLTVSDEEKEACPNCDPEEVVKWMKRFLPTMVVKTVTADSEEGKDMIKKYNLNVVPSLVFSKEVAETGFFQDEAKMLFKEKEGSYVLDLVGMGAPVGKYISLPTIGEDDPVIGNRDGKVEIVVYSDYQCPFCSKYFNEVVALAEEYKDDVALTYKDLPLEFHPQAMNAALAANCALEQGEEQFWNMSKQLYANQKKWEGTKNKEDFEIYAHMIGLELGKYKECMEEERHADKIKASADEAKGFGVSGTPASFIGEKFVSGVLSKDQLKAVVEDQLADDEEGATQEEEAAEEKKEE